MTISIACSTCGSKLKANENLAGRQLKCPKCGSAVVVKPSGNVMAKPVGGADHPPLASAPLPAPVPAVIERAASDYKDCPYCGEQILVKAKKCKHCGEMLEEALRGVDEPRRQADSRGGDSPVVIMNSNTAGASIVEVAPRRPRGPSGGVAAILELLFGLFLGTFGIGHMYAGRVAFGVLVMFGGWFVLAANVALLFFCGIGVVTLPVCWIALLIISPILAASACR